MSGEMYSSSKVEAMLAAGVNFTPARTSGTRAPEASVA